LPDRRDGNEPALLPVELAQGPAGERTVTPIIPGATSPDWGRRIEAAVKQQSVDLRRFVVASLDSLAARLTSDLRNAVPAPAAPVPEPAAPPRRQSPWPWVLGVAAVGALAALSTFLWTSTRADLAKAHAELAALQAADAGLKQSVDRLGDSLKDISAALAASAASAANAPASPAVAGLPRSEPVPYGELPFDRGRLDALRDVLTKLEAQNFRGVLKVTSLPGMFCLSGNAADGFAPAPASLPIGKCDLVGNPFEEGLSGQQHQSIAFANLVAGVRQKTSGAITVAVENAAAPRAATPYPARSDSLTAGEWNRAAAANNRVEFAAEPASSPSP
jgi:hypothetical protein